MKQSNHVTRFVVCIKNEGYVASLEIRKIYRALPDARAARHRMIRVIDESGEDYMYPADYFTAIKVPSVTAKAFAMAEQSNPLECQSQLGGTCFLPFRENGFLTKVRTKQRVHSVRMSFAKTCRML